MLRRKSLVAISSAVAALAIASVMPASAQEIVFLSTQLRPIEEAQKVRDVLLKGAPSITVAFIRDF